DDGVETTVDHRAQRLLARGLRPVVSGKLRAQRPRAGLVDHARLIAIERVNRADVHEAAHAGVERDTRRVAHAVDVDRAHRAIGVAGDRDIRWVLEDITEAY